MEILIGLGIITAAVGFLLLTLFGGFFDDGD